MLEQLKSARLFFESGMVRIAALQANPDDLAALEETLARQRAAIGDRELFVSADLDFHIRIAATTRNPIFEAVSEAMLGWLRRHYTQLVFWQGREEVTLSEHAGILAGLAARDPDRAEAAMVRHIRRASDLYGAKP
jgi:DNA-binding FadR family transcriptional regulator